MTDIERQILLAISDPGAFIARRADHTESSSHWSMRAIVTAVLPAHETMIRAKIADEIERFLQGLDLGDHPQPYRDGHQDAVRDAIHIARGDQ